jgi:hypothetical protein
VSQRIIRKFQETDSLYLCRFNSQEVDDLHILYATLFDQSNRSQPTYAVTNDFMRNHAASAFSSMQLFYRWRKTQVVNYVITSRVKPHLSPHSLSEVNELILSLPGRHHHAMQFSSENSHWHIPIVDRLNTWLCLSIEKTPKFTQQNCLLSETVAAAAAAAGAGGGGGHGKEFEWMGFDEEVEEEFEEATGRVVTGRVEQLAGAVDREKQKKENGEELDQKIKRI